MEQIADVLTQRALMMCQTGQANSQKTTLQQQSNMQERTVCNKCKGTTWIIHNDYAERCECYEIDLLKRIWESSGLSADQKKISLETFKVTTDKQRQMKSIAIQYFKDFQDIKQSRNNSISYLGQPGAGKSHITIALASGLLKKGNRVLYVPYRDFISKAKQNKFDEVGYQRLINTLKNVEVLFIDDLLKGHTTGDDRNILFEVINHRYLNYKPIIVSSELTTEDLLGFDEAIGSRIIEMCKGYIVEVVGKQYNFRLKNIS